MFRRNVNTVDDFKNYYVHTANFTEYKLVWVENTIIFIDSQNTLLGQAQVRGSIIQTQSDKWHEIDQFWSRRIDSIKRVIQQAQIIDSLEIFDLDKIKTKYINGRDKNEVQFIKENINLELAPYFIFSIKDAVNLKELKILYNLLNEERKSEISGVKVNEHISKFEKLEINSIAPNFRLNNLDGKEISLSSLKGKYVLLVFWISSCDICIKENIHHSNLYKKYKDKNIEILGVCLDESKEEWESTIARDSIRWKTVSDLNGISGEVPTLFDVNYTPKTYLIDTNGVIIGKDLRSDILNDNLNKLLIK